MLQIISYPEIKFPDNFLWGSATAGHQIEGNNVHSNYWEIEHASGYKNTPSGKACNHYELFERDIELLDQLGHRIFRFSIEWSRIEPEQGKYDKASLTHYLRELTLLKQKDISTMVTLCHYSVPAWFASLGGFQKRENIIFFENYVRHLLPKVASHIDFITILNEFNIIGPLGSNPTLCMEFRANCLVAHGRCYRIIKELSPSIPVSSAHALRVCIPENPYDAFDRQYADFDDWISNEFFFHAIRTGEIVLPFRDGENVPELKDSVDFWAMNYYCQRIISARSAKFDGKFPFSTRLKMINRDFYLENFYPEGLTAALLRLKDLPVMITENGVAADDDRFRIIKLALDLAALYEASLKGVNVSGYLHWSLMDNYEWGSFVPRFGLVDVDFDTFKRTPKPSSAFYCDIIARNGLDGQLIKKYIPELPDLKLY